MTSDEVDPQLYISDKIQKDFDSEKPEFLLIKEKFESYLQSPSFKQEEQFLFLLELINLEFGRFQYIFFEKKDNSKIPVNSCNCDYYYSAKSFNEFIEIFLSNPKIEKYEIQINEGEIKYFAEQMTIAWLIIAGDFIVEPLGRDTSLYYTNRTKQRQFICLKSFFNNKPIQQLEKREILFKYFPEHEIFQNDDFLSYLIDTIFDYWERKEKIYNPLFFTKLDWKNKTEKFTRINNEILAIAKKEYIDNQEITKGGFKVQVFLSYWIKTFAPLIKYVRDWKEWVIYEEGIYRKIDFGEIRNIIQNFLKELKITICVQTKANMIDAIRDSDLSLYLKDFDSDPNILNCKNGLLDRSTLILKNHTPNYYSLNQIPKNYLGNDNHTETPLWDSFYKDFKDEFFKIEYYIRSILYGDMRDGLGLWIFGVRSSGKGTIMNVIDDILYDYCSHQLFQSLNDRFGMYPLVGKLVNLNKELPVSKLGALAIQRYKTITGRDGIIPIEEKNKNIYEVNFEPFFFINATNQLPELGNTDHDSFFKRTLIAIISKKRENPDLDLKDKIKEEEDAIFTKLMNQKYISYNKDHYMFVDPRQEFESEEIYKKRSIFNEDRFILENKDTWEKYSDSITIICRLIFEQTTDLNPNNESYHYSKEFVLDCVTEELVKLGYTNNFSETVMKARITVALKKMKIKAGRYNYTGIILKDNYKDEYPNFENDLKENKTNKNQLNI